MSPDHRLTPRTERHARTLISSAVDTAPIGTSTWSWRLGYLLARGAIMGTVLVRPLVAGDRSWTDSALSRVWGSTSVARKGELVDAAELPGFAAIVDGQPVGLATYASRGRDLEVVTVHSEQEGRGVGRALMDAVLHHAQHLGAQRIWLVTTNDNIRALRFYQQWGMDLVALNRDGVAKSRTVKPSIPTIGAHQIPVRHELELELKLRPTEPSRTAGRRPE